MEPNLAIKRERQLKKWSHAKKIAFIKGDFESLKRLSKSREKQATITTQSNK